MLLITYFKTIKDETNLSGVFVDEPNTCIKKIIKINWIMYHILRAVTNKHYQRQANKVWSKMAVAEG